MNIRHLYTNLNQFYNLEYRDFHLLNPKYIINGSKLTWSKYVPRENQETYEEYFQWVLDQGQFSLQIGDFAVIQIFFEEDMNHEVYRGSLSFLPEPTYLYSYFRFDFDSLANINYTHNSYHVNFGYKSDDLRFSLKRFPYPSEFIKFALFLTAKKEIASFPGTNFFTDLDSMKEDYNHCIDFRLD